MADIQIGLMQINVQCDEHGRVEMDYDEALHGRPPRTPGIRTGENNLGVGNILIFDANGDPNVISEDENNDRVHVGWDLKTISGVKEKEHIVTFTLGDKPMVNQDEAVRDGDKVVPFDCIRVGGTTSGSAWRTHFNVAHFMYNGSQRGELWVRQWRVTGDGVRHESEWFGAYGGRGLRFGSQV